MSDENQLLVVQTHIFIAFYLTHTKSVWLTNLLHKNAFAIDTFKENITVAQYTHDVVSTSIRHLYDVRDVA